jgi:hypothetical protein
MMASLSYTGITSSLKLLRAMKCGGSIWSHVMALTLIGISLCLVKVKFMIA